MADMMKTLFECILSSVVETAQLSKAPETLRSWITDLQLFDPIEILFKYTLSPRGTITTFGPRA